MGGVTATPNPQLFAAAGFPVKTAALSSEFKGDAALLFVSAFEKNSLTFIKDRRGLRFLKKQLGSPISVIF